MAGTSVESFIPLRFQAVLVEPTLVTWIKSWWEGHTKLEVLSLEGAFRRGHDVMGYKKNLDGIDYPVLQMGCFVCYPPPCVTEAVMEELQQIKHKQTNLWHVFVCPKVRKSAWIGQLYKAANIAIDIIEEMIN